MSKSLISPETSFLQLKDPLTYPESYSLSSERLDVAALRAATLIIGFGCLQ